MMDLLKLLGAAIVAGVIIGAVALASGFFWLWVLSGVLSF